MVCSLTTTAFDSSSGVIFFRTRNLHLRGWMSTNEDARGRDPGLPALDQLPPVGHRLFVGGLEVHHRPDGQDADELHPHPQLQRRVRPQRDVPQLRRQRLHLPRLDADGTHGPRWGCPGWDVNNTDSAQPTCSTITTSALTAPCTTRTSPIKRSSGRAPRYSRGSFAMPTPAA